MIGIAVIALALFWLGVVVWSCIPQKPRNEHRGDRAGRSELNAIVRRMRGGAPGWIRRQS